MSVSKQDKSGNQERNAVLFHHCHVTNMSVVLNDDRYPMLNANANFTQNQYVQFYKEVSEFLRKYYGADPMITNANLNPNSYKDLTPLYVFDVSKQNERLDNNVINIKVEMQFSVNVPANTRAYALVISDRRIRLQSDGKKMNVLF